MSKKLLAFTSLVLAVALLLSACGPNYVTCTNQDGWGWFNLGATAVREGQPDPTNNGFSCGGDGKFHPAGTTNGAPPYVSVPPAATLAPEAPLAAPEATAAPAATQAPAAPLAPVAGTCTRDGQSVANDSNRARAAMSYFGGTSEACIFFGEVNFGLTSNGKGLTVLMVIPPQWTLNVNGMLGYAFWARESEGAVDWSIQDSTANLTRPDGRAEATPVVVHIDNEAEMAGLTELVRGVYPAFAFKLIPPALP